MKNIVFVDFGDWQGLYVNGTLTDEDSCLDVRSVLRSLDIEFDQKEGNPDWLDTQGDMLPRKLSSVRFA